MSSFTKPLKVEILENGRLYALIDSFEYYRTNDRNSSIIIPSGFITDFATTPRFLWSILPPFGRYSKSCVLHDYLCLRARLGMLSRREADLIFLESLRAIKINKITTYTLYFGVRIYAIFKGLK